MRRNQNQFAGLFIVALLWLIICFPQRAQALQYTDPGTTALFVQLIGTFIFGLVFYFGIFRTWLARKLNRNKNVAGTNESEALMNPADEPQERS